MSKSGEEQIQELKNAIAAQEGLRATLGDEMVEIVLQALRRQLAELESRQGTVEHQRKQVTVLFADVKGFTAMSERMDVEDISEIMNALWERLDQVILQHGGHIDKHVGDGVMALWGVEAAREDDPERAVRAALALQNEISQFCTDVGPETTPLDPAGRTLQLRIGLHTGPAFLGEVGTTGEFTAMGDTVNTASRLEGAAPVGGVLISHTTYAQVRGLFEVRVQEPLELKGKKDRLQAYLVKAARPHAFRMKTRGVLGLETQMVGRDGEFERLQGLYRAVLEQSQAQIVTILGDPGVGKSRLQFEFERWLGAQAVDVHLLKGRALQETRELPFHLLRDMLADCFEVLDSDAASVAQNKLEAGLAQYLDEEAQMKAHFIGALLGFAFEDSAHLRGVREDPTQLRARAFFYLSQFFAGLARSSPVVIFLEDIHWADAASLDGLIDLSQACLDLPLLFVCLARPTLFEAFPRWQNWGTGAAVTHTFIRLAPLTRQACLMLVDQIFQNFVSVPDELREQIVATAEGNPYYVEELINKLGDDRVILREPDGCWRLDEGRLGDRLLPPTLTAVLQARFDSLSQAEKTILQGAAVIGRIFWRAALESLPGMQASLERDLQAIMARELIFPRQESLFDETSEYIFKHALMRDAVYQSVLKGTRRRYHASVASWFIATTRTSGRADEFSTVIADHLSQAGKRQEAVEWYFRAGKRASRLGAMQEARRLYGRALEHLSPQDDELRWRILLARDEALAILGNLEDRQADEAALMELANRSGKDDWLAQAFYRQGTFASTRGNEIQALEAFDAALEFVLRSEDRTLQANLLGAKTISLARLGRMEQAEIAAQQALEIGREVGEAELLARVFTNVSVYYSTAGDFARATRLLQQQAQVMHDSGNLNGEAVVYGNLGYNYTLLGLYEPARAALEQAARLAQSIGARRLYAYCLLNLSLSRIRSKDWRAAMQTLEQAGQELEKRQDRFGQAAQWNYTGLCRELAGEFPEAQRSYSQARQIFDEIEMHALAIDALAGMARCDHAQSDLPAARRRAAVVRDYLCEHEGAGMEFPVLAYLTCAQVSLAAGDRQQAWDMIAAGNRIMLAQASRISDPAWRVSYLENVWEHRTLATMYLEQSAQAVE